MSTTREAPAKAAPRLALRSARWQEACKRRGLLTDDARAAAIGVSRNQVQRIQQKTCIPGSHFIARACAYFHCPIDSLFEVEA